MSEKLTQSAEAGAEFKDLKGPERRESHDDRTETKPEKQAELALEARAEIEETTKSAERPALPIDDNPRDNQPAYIDKAVQRLRLQQNMNRVRRQLPPVSRAFSRVVHQPVVRAASEVGAKTVTRPSGLLGGGICAFLGSLFYLYLARHVGFQYNYLVFLVFFVGGFVIGLVIELLLRFMPHRSTGE